MRRLDLRAPRVDSRIKLSCNAHPLMSPNAYLVRAGLGLPEVWIPKAAFLYRPCGNLSVPRRGILREDFELGAHSLRL